MQFSMIAPLGMPHVSQLGASVMLSSGFRCGKYLWQSYSWSSPAPSRALKEPGEGPHGTAVCVSQIFFFDFL